MSVDKFKFAGPSIQVAEIDESRIEQPVAGIGPVVIGRTAKGPAMAPVTVTTVAELERIFGAPYSGKSSVVDVWRDGNQLAPTYATYAAKAFLQNSSPVTIVRTLGTQNPEVTTTSAQPGWDVNMISASNAKSQGLYLFNSSSAAISGTLVAVFHGVGGSGEGYLPWHLSGAADNMIVNTLVECTGSEIALTNLSTGNVDRKYVISFDQAKSNFIRKVLNTDPTKAKSLDKAEYFLAETFESAALEYTTQSGKYYAAMVTLPASASSARFGYESAESGIVFGQHTNVPAAYDPNSSGSYPVEELFKFVTLNGGDWEQSNIKIVIENIKTAPYPLSDPYGTFDVVLKSLFSDETLESYRGLNLNQNSPSYIANAIGDTYFEWSYSEGRYKEIGLYRNKSARIRVEMFNNITDPYQLPFGFYGPRAPKGKANNLASSSPTAFAATTIGTGSYAGITSISASFPSISLLEQNTKALSRTTWGFTYDKKAYDVKDLLRLNALTHETDKEVGYPTCFFSLDDIGTTGTGSYSKWELGLRKSGKSYSSSGSADYTETLKFANSFAMPLFGGFDGVNIFEKEPIVNNTLLSSKTAETSYEYNTLDVALKSISDKEVIETDIICIPGLTNAALIQELIDVCEQRGDALALIDIEDDYTPEHESTSTLSARLPIVKNAIESIKDRGLDSTYAAAYYPAVYESTQNIFLPATVAALGVMGGTEGNSALWFAPAGFIRGGISQTTAGLSVSRAAQHLTAKERDDLYNVNVNPLATFPNEGVVIFGQKTLQTIPSALSRINVRRLLNYIKRNVSTVAKGVLFEPNVEATWNNFKNRVEPFLALVKTNFGLEDFRVILDNKTTTADLVDRNIMYAKILLKPTRTIEYIAVDFVITNSGAVFTA